MSIILGLLVLLALIALFFIIKYTSHSLESAVWVVLEQFAHLILKCIHLVLNLQVLQLYCLLIWFSAHKIHFLALLQRTSECPKPAHLVHWEVLGVFIYFTTVAGTATGFFCHMTAPVLRTYKEPTLDYRTSRTQHQIYSIYQNLFPPLPCRFVLSRYVISLDLIDLLFTEPRISSGGSLHATLLLCGLGFVPPTYFWWPTQGVSYYWRRN